MDYKQNDFEEVYKNLINIYGTKLEKYRQFAIYEKKKNRNTIVKTILIGIIAILVVLYLMFFIQKNIEILAIIFAGIVFFVPVYAIKTAQKDKKNKEYHTLFKKDVINYLISIFSDNFNYEPDGKITDRKIAEKSYIAANFEKFKLIFSHDFITGVFNKTKEFKIADVCTYYKTLDNYYKKSFEGLFATVDIEQQVNTEIFIRGNKNLSFDMPYKKLKIEMDSDEFEKIFDVYTSNQVIAMQLLTADIMEMIVDFYNNTRRKFDITIKNNNIYLRVAGFEIFEILDLDKSSINQENIHRNYLILEFIFKLTDKLSKLIDEAPL